MTFPDDVNGLGTVTGSQTLAGAGHATRHNEVKTALEGIRDVLGGTAVPSGTVQPVLAAGSAAAPSLAFTGDSNTGVWSPGADTVAASTGGTERMRIDSSGIVSVGSPPTPAGRLHVAGDTSATIISQRAGGGGAVLLRGSNGTLAAPTANVSSDLLGLFSVQGYDGTAHIAAAQIAALVDGTPGTNDMPTRLTFSTTADGASSVTERMRIDSAGNVGIGTSSPGFRLAVQSGDIGITQSSANAALWLTSSGGSGRQWIVISGTNGGLSFYDNTGASERFRIDNAGLITGTGTSLGAWTAYTPTLGGTGWAIGDGTATGAYCQIGKVVHFRARIVFGSTSTFGAAAAVTLTAPVTSRNDGASTTILTRLFDSSLSTTHNGIGSLAINSTTITVNYWATGTTVSGSSATNPFTWASSDQIIVFGTYEAA